MKRDISDSELAKRIQRLVEIIGDSSKLARASGLGVTTVRSLLSGGVDPTRTTMMALAEATGTTIEWISTGKGPMYKKDLAGADISNEHDAGYVCPGPAKPGVPDFMEPGLRYPAKYQDIVDAVIEVLSSDDDDTISALSQNAFTFQKTVRFGQKITQLENDIEAIKKVLDPRRLSTEAKKG